MSEGGLIKVPHVQRVKGKDGKVHLYFRKGGYREGPLANPDGSQALLDEVTAIRKRVEKIEAIARKPVAGTVGGMLKATTSRRSSCRSPGLRRPPTRTTSTSWTLTSATSTCPR